MSDAQYKYDGIAICDDWRCGGCGGRRAVHDLGCFTRKEHDFVGMLRIRNESRWIREVLESILPLCDQVYVLDDHSTDGTVELCRTYSRVKVFDSPFAGLNESRDKNWLYDQIILECAPRWILCIDGDEVLEKQGAAVIRHVCLDTTRASLGTNAYALKIEYLWNDPGTVRTDRIYGDFWRPSLFRPQHEDPDTPDTRTLLKEFRFMATPFGRVQNGDQPNLHCSSVPQRLLHGFKLCPARLKHYGYMERASRVAKLNYYTKIDWLNASEDCYRHMCQGDGVTLDELPAVRALADASTISWHDAAFITNVPSDTPLVHAGPIQLAPWSESWEMSDYARGRNR